MIKDVEEEFPLVSILIPTYNQTKYLKYALDSAINQTYKNIEIIISDDSTTEEVYNFIKPYLNKNNNIKYIKNTSKSGYLGRSNIINLFNESNGKYINYLYHDDIYEISKIEKMINCFLNDNSISLVTSSRYFIDDKGNKLRTFSICNNNSDLKIDGKSMAKLMISSKYNYIGEPTTAMFKKSLLKKEIFDLKDQKIFGLMDMSMWLDLCFKGNIMYLNEPLSSFRLHNEQNSQNSLCIASCFVDHIHLSEEYSKSEYGCFDEEEKQSIIKNWYLENKNVFINFLLDYKPSENEIPLYNELKTNINEIIRKYDSIL